MIRIALRWADLGKTVFAYSPMAEVTSSLRMLSSGTVPAVHRLWYDDIRTRLSHLDWPVLRAVAPYRHRLPLFLFARTDGTKTSAERQLEDVADVPSDVVRYELERTWYGEAMPETARSIIADGCAGGRRIAEAMWDYWSIAVAPYWGQIRAVVDDDIGHRSAVFANGGMAGVISGLHPQMQVDGDTVLINKQDDYVTNPRGAGLRLIPSVFVWPHLAYANYAPAAPTIAYSTRRLSDVWASGSSHNDQASALTALIGKTRTSVLLQLALPQTTTAIAERLELSRAAVSQHLTLLHRQGLLTSRRSGRCVLYQRTALADELIAANPDTECQARERS